MACAWGTAAIVAETPAMKANQVQGSGSFHNHEPPHHSLFHVHSQWPLAIAPINEHPAAPGNERSS